MNYYDPSSHSQESCDQSAYSYYSYSYSYPNPQFSSNIHPYSYPNPIVQPSQNEEQEPNPPGVTPPQPLPERSYYQHQAHGVAAAVPTVGPHQGAVPAGPAVIHQPIVQPLYGGSGIVGGIAPGGDAQVHRVPELNRPSYPFHVNGRGRGSGLPMNAAMPFHDQTVIAYGGLHVQGGSSQLGETHHGPGRKVSGRVYRVRGCVKGHVPRKQDKSDILGVASLLTTESGPDQPAFVLPHSKAVCCELCKVECNTLEVLQQHMSGKKHKKKLKIFEELQNLNNKVIGIQTEQTSTDELKAEVLSQPAQQEVLPSQEIKVVGEKRKTEEVESPEESAKKTGVGPMKRKLKGGRSNIKLKPSGLSKSLAQPPKPKEVAAPLVCELCNVKCESVVVFQSHLAGKKHNSKAKCFLSQVTSGQELHLQAQRPAMPAVNQSNGNALTSTGFLLHDQGF